MVMQVKYKLVGMLEQLNEIFRWGGGITDKEVNFMNCTSIPNVLSLLCVILEPKVEV